MAHMPDSLDTNAKALRINLDPTAYGAFAEIGGGQEASRWFFRVGGAAGTVAKTMSAYDMAVSDAIYGSGERYVSRERLRSMLAHEYDLLLQRLGATRGEKTAFFAFADTVATRSFKGGNECHGWMGLRFQHAPGAPPSDILLHAALQDPTADQQQQTLGVLGVNLIFGACYLLKNLDGFLKSLLDGLSLRNVEIDVVDCRGPAFGTATDQRELATRMLAHGLTPAVVFDEKGMMEQPSTVFRKRAVILHRCSMKRENPELERMLKGSVALLESEGIKTEREPLRMLELCVPESPAEPDAAGRAPTAAIDRVFRPGHASMLTRFPETYRVSMYIRRSSNDPIRFVLGLDAVVTVLRDSFYAGRLEGGLLEGLGRLLAPNVKLYIFPMRAEVLREQLRLHDVEPGFWSAPDKPVLCADDISIAPPAGHLLEFLKSAGWVVSASAAALEC
jgi:hypothetical protein